MTETTTITITRQVPVDPERAYAAWLDVAELAQWWWPQWPDTTYELDPREGGAYRIFSAAVGVGVEGRFTTVDRPRTLVMTWTWIDDDTEADATAVVDTVDVRFTPNAEGTEVTVRHTSTEQLAGGGFEQGWNDVMDRLPGHLAAR
ncbi:SRPBCC family protein [Pseudactinotalea suaedae]|uniref:SRPBCC family protein n=1 Tax=Pseudactinotalea suaedae TaxID=1524924 RepID=UPI0012E18846|nr:SRPBCC family protein [Pseudactinotalea suaedae]